jgi:hypothetical protein
MHAEQVVSTSGDPGGFPAYRDLNPVARLNLVEGFGCSEEEQGVLGGDAALVLIVFPQNGKQLPFLAVAAKDVGVADRLSTARFYLEWRTADRKRRQCVLYVGAQTLHRQEIGKGIRLFANLETAGYEEEEHLHRSFRALEDFAQLTEVAMTLGPEDARTILDTNLMSPTHAHALRYLRFEVRL